MRLLISAGDASGEVYGAQLIDALRKRGGEWEFFGLGGEKMRAAGCDLVVESRDVTVVGLFEVLSHMRGIYRDFRLLVNAARTRKPGAAVLIDFPDFNLRLARRLHQRGIPIIYLVSPQLWAWRQSRVKQVRKYVRKMLVIFPFEEAFYRRHGVEATFIGHPLAALRQTQVSRQQFAAENALDVGKTWIGLLPGSRQKEVRMNLPVMLKAAELLATGNQGSDYQFVLPVASTLSREWMSRQIAETSANVVLASGAFETLSLCRAAVVASGTATVEAAMAQTPFIAVYRVSPLTWLVGRRLVKVPHFAMVNLIAGKQIVPELVQAGFTAAETCRHLRELLPDGAPRETMRKELAAIRTSLLVADRSDTRSPSERAAAEVLRIVQPPATTL